MNDPSRLRFTPKTLVSFTSASGRRVTQVKGGLLTGMFELLRDMGELERLLGFIPAKARQEMQYLVASSWVDVEHASLLFDALDSALPLASDQAKLGEALGSKIANSLFSALLSAVRPAGSEGVLLALKQSERMWVRMYEGGGMIVTQSGPKDAQIEVIGVPFAGSRSFQQVHGAFLRGITLTIVKTCVIRKAPSRSTGNDAYAVDLSWV